MLESAHKGFSLVELVVAIGIFLVLGTGITYLATGSYTYFTGTGDTRLQERFAQDALETLDIIKDRSWSDIESNDGGDSVGETGGVRIDKDANGDWVISSGSETRGAFTRYIYISTVQRNSNDEIVTSGGIDDPSTKKVVVVIRATGLTDYHVESYLNNWDAVRMFQTDWSGVANDEIWTSGQTDYATSTDLTLGASISVE